MRCEKKGKEKGEIAFWIYRKRRRRELVCLRDRVRWLPYCVVLNDYNTMSFPFTFFLLTVFIFFVIFFIIKLRIRMLRESFKEWFIYLTISAPCLHLLRKVACTFFFFTFFYLFILFFNNRNIYCIKII